MRLRTKETNYRGMSFEMKETMKTITTTLFTAVLLAAPPTLWAVNWDCEKADNRLQIALVAEETAWMLLELVQNNDHESTNPGLLGNELAVIRDARQIAIRISRDWAEKCGWR